jgi:hypothetical protein
MKKIKKTKNWKKYQDWRYCLDILKIRFKDRKGFCENCAINEYVRKNLEHIIKKYKLEKDDKVILDKDFLYLIALALAWDVEQYYIDMLTLKK